MALDAVQQNFPLKARVVQTKHLGLQALNRFTIANPQQLQGGDLKKHKIQVLASEIKQNL